MNDKSTALANLTNLATAAGEYAQSSVSPGTKDAYRSDFEHFTEWAASNKLDNLPAEPKTVALYITHLANGLGLKISTIRRRLVAISQVHQAAGYPNPPTKDAGVRAVMKGIKRTHRNKQDRKKGLTSNQVRAWVGSLTDTPQDIRDKAIILLGFAGAFRRSEIVSLDFSSLSFVDQGVIITLERSKTNQSGDLEQIGIPYGQHPDSCPVLALRAWLELAAIEQGPVFVGIRRGGHIQTNRLTPKSVALIVKRLCRDLGLSENDCREYAGHSLRAGHVTQATNNGSPRHITKMQTRHKSDKVFDGYYREGSMFRDNSGNYLDL